MDLDGRPYPIPPWTSKSEGAATIITGMVDPTITGKFTMSYIGINY